VERDAAASAQENMQKVGPGMVRLCC
jgi:hypothetical protein